MAHNLESNANGTHSFFSSTKAKAWHGLGQYVDGAQTAEEALKLANLDFEVIKSAVTINLPDGTQKVSDKMFSTIRKDNNAILGYVGSRYEVLQNKQCFDFFDAVVGAGEAIYETAGVFGIGERIFITAKMPEHITINGKRDDLIENYVFLTNSHDGKGVVTAAITPVRIVCNNTLNMALGQCSNKVTLKHTTNMHSKLQAAHEIMGLKNELNAEIEAIFSAMAKKQVGDDFYKKVAVHAIAKGAPKLISDYYEGNGSTRFKNIVDEVLQFSATDGTQKMSNTYMTAYGALNSISGYFQNAKVWGNKESEKTESILDGDVSKSNQIAYNLCKDLIILS